jgi:hypothetical protein
VIVPRVFAVRRGDRQRRVEEMIQRGRPLLRERRFEHLSRLAFLRIVQGSITAGEHDWSGAEVRDFVAKREASLRQLFQIDSALAFT